MGGTSLLLLALAAQATPQWEVFGVAQGLPNDTVRSITVSSSGAVWMGLQGVGLARLFEDDLTLTTQEDGLISNGVADLLEDTQGRLWATGLGGYSVYEAGRWTGHAEVAGLRPRVVFSAHEDPTGEAIWLAANGGAARFGDQGWTTVVPSDGLPHPVVHAVLVDRGGAEWFACRSGLARRVGDSIEVFFPNTNFRSIVEANDGSIFFGTSRGVLRWDGEAWEWSLEGQTVLPSVVTGDGSVWATSEEDGLFQYQQDSWSHIALPTATVGVVIYDAAVAPDGSIWLGTSHGALRGTFTP